MKMLIVTLLFFIIANPALFKVTRALGGWVASPEGCPRTGGLLLHGIVFAIVTRLIMRMLIRRKMRRYYSQYEDFEDEKYEDFEDEKYEDEKYEDEKYAEPEAYEEFKEEEYGDGCGGGKHYNHKMKKCVKN
jgi:flagellar biosynthesis/type III secretory pathway M-ring protein FliF/YscJ